MSNRTTEDLIELDPYNLDSTTIKYLDLENLTKAELCLCVERLLEELYALESNLYNPTIYEDLN